MQADRKVYDSDLAITPLLREIAHTYAREYVGNFDMMIEASAYIKAHGQLTEGMYRPVLNTLRSDVLRQDLWAAVVALRSPATGPYEAPVVTADGPSNVVRIEVARKQRAPREPDPTFKVLVSGRCKVPFATSKHMSHRPVVHLLQAPMQVQWWRHRLPSGNLDYTRPCEVFTPQPRLVCGKHFFVDRMSYWWESPTYDLAYPEKWDDGDVVMPFCRACVKAVQDPDRIVEPVFRGEVW